MRSSCGDSGASASALACLPASSERISSRSRLVGSLTSAVTCPKLTGSRHVSRIGFTFRGERSGELAADRHPPPQVVLPALGVAELRPAVPRGELRVAPRAQGLLLGLRQRASVGVLAGAIGLGEPPRRALQLALEAHRFVRDPVAELLVVLADEAVVRSNLGWNSRKRCDRGPSRAAGECCYQKVHSEVGAT